MAIDARAPEERFLGAARAQHVPRRISQHRVEAAVRERLSRLVEVRLWKFEHPVKEAMRGGDVVGVVQKGCRRFFRKAAASRHQFVRQRCEHRRIRRFVRVRPHPACAPEIGHRFPVARLCAVHRGGVLFRGRHRPCRRACRRASGARRPRAQATAPDRRRRRAASTHGSRRRAREPGAWRLSCDVDGRCADQAVAADEVVIEKRQRLAGRKRREPEREARELHRRRIQVDAEETSLRDDPPEHRAVRFVDIRLAGRAVANQRPFVGAREISARRDEKGRAAHRRIHDAQLENAIGRRAVDQRMQRAPHDVVGERLRCVERAGRLARVASSPKQHLISFRVCVGRLVIEHALVHRAELLDAKVAIVDARALCRMSRT